MKKVYIGLLLVSMGVQAKDKISCNERVKHGSRGYCKGLVALGSVIAGGYFVLDIIDKAPDLKVPDDLNHKEHLRRWPLMKELLFKSLAASALGYVAWKFGKESKESLTIFYSDDLEAEKAQSRDQ